MEVAELLIYSIIPLVLVVAFLAHAARGIYDGRGLSSVRETIPVLIVLLVAIAVIGTVGAGDDPDGPDDPDDPVDEGDVPVGMLLFDTSSGTTATLTGISEDYEVPEGGYRLVVPSTYEGLPVKAVAGLTDDEEMTRFEGCISFASTSIETVGIAAFFSSSSLASVSLPAATSIGNWVFFECFSLASVSLPAATSIGEDAFYGCRSLASVSLPAATSIGEDAFNGCESLASVSLPAATSIGEGAFWRCFGVTEVSFGPLTGELSDLAFGVWTFYASDATTVLAKTAANLAGRTFQGTAAALVELEMGRTSLSPAQLESVSGLTAAYLEELEQAMTLDGLDPEELEAMRQVAAALSATLQDIDLAIGGGLTPLDPVRPGGPIAI